jgi:FKBP-type peptidyl-prolyl cis-trans isomerase
MKKGNTIVVNMKVVAVESMQEYQKDMQQKQAEMMKKMDEQKAQQAPVDDKILQDYFAKNNIKPMKTADGLYYVIEKEGKGEKAKAGEMVTMNYTGKTLDGKTFDSNTDPAFKHTEPFKFPLGQGRVIPGWDEGVQLLNKGSKATLYIPSPLAYGPQGSRPNIEPNTILMFDVEVVDIEAAPKNPAPAANEAPAQ